MNEDDFLRIQRSNRSFIQKLFADIPECIVSGAACVAPGAGNNLVVTSDGYVWLDGEMLKVDAGTHIAGDPTWTDWHYVKATTYESGGNKTYVDGTPRQTWQKNRAKPVSVVSIPGGGLDCVVGQRWFKNNIVHRKIVDIGVWDMDTDITATVLHGLADYKKIRSIQVIIREDSDVLRFPLNRAHTGTGAVSGGVENISTVNIILHRIPSGFFDSANFNDVVMNRGYVIIDYID